MLKLLTCGGNPGGPVLVALVEVSGVPLFIPVFSGVLGPDGTFTTQSFIPPGFSGIDLGLRSFAQAWDGRIRASNTALVELR